MTAQGRNQTMPRSHLRQMVSRVLFFGLIFPAAVFGLAGRLDWPAGWLFTGAYVAYAFAFMIWGLRRDPALLQERASAGRRTDVSPKEKIVLRLAIGLELATMALAVLDGGRFQWSRVPPLVQLLGWLAVGGAAILFFAVQRINTYASTVVRIQTERGHQVISGGPYRVVRHPMYGAVILFMLGLPLALGSGWALLPGGLMTLLVIFRTVYEDRTLQRELAGYADYARRVRFRLLPGVW